MKTKMLMPVAFFVAAASVVAAPPEERLRVTVPGGTPLDLGAAEIAALPHTEVRAVDSHGKGGLFRGVDLLELLHRAGAASGDALRGSHLRDVVRVECADDYVVAFTLAELDPAMGARRVLLADGLDGKPLGVEQGPWRLVVPDDKRPARWARQVKKVAVVVLD
jgi:DMSO/TMAO reductase YedYZ molybdopterin-dependent catalytic subunit